MEYRGRVSLLFAISLLVFWPSSSGAGQYTFTKIAESGGGIAGFGNFSINDGGKVEFLVRLTDGTEKILVGDGVSTTTIADTTGDFFRFLSGGHYGKHIGGSGAVAFLAQRNSGEIGLFLGDGVTTKLIVDNTGTVDIIEQLTINQGDTVAFRRVFSDDTTAIFRGNTEGVVALVTSDDILKPIGGSVILDNDEVAYIDLLGVGNKRRIVVTDGVSAQILAESEGIGVIAINNQKTVAYFRAIVGSVSIVVTDGTISTTLVEDTGSGPFRDFSNFGIADDGIVVFGANVGLGGADSGIFFGPDPVLDKIIRTGDDLFGSTVTQVGFIPGALNKNGTLAFFAQLNDGRSVIARAEPPRKIYWTVVNRAETIFSIQRANLDGSDVEGVVLAVVVPSPIGIALDAAGGKMYWADNSQDKVQRANLDGTDIEDLVTMGLSGLQGLGLDAAGGKIYWADSETVKIQRANLDGSTVEDLVVGTTDHPFGLAVDATLGKVYWVGDRVVGGLGTGIIQRANLDGSNLEDLITTGLVGPSGIALDPAGGKMYWTDANTDKIQRANLDGTGIEDLITTGLGSPVGLALDLETGKIYWADANTDKIQRSNLDGSNVEDLVTTGVIQPLFVALGGISDPPSAFLEFPLVAETPWTASTSSVHDHNVKTDKDGVPFYYKKDLNGIVQPYNGVSGVKDCGLKPSKECVQFAGKFVRGYKNEDDLPFLTVGDINYTGGGGCRVKNITVACISWLFYDGHAGYDYPAPLGTPIVAPADGHLFVPESDPITAGGGTNPKGAGAVVDKFFAMALQHDNGFTTWYLHVGREKGTAGFPPSEQDFRMVSKGEEPVFVEQGMVIGMVGNKGLCNKNDTCDAGLAHLHFEVRTGVSDFRCEAPTCQVIDPYGPGPRLWLEAPPE